MHTPERFAIGLAVLAFVRTIFAVMAREDCKQREFGAMVIAQRHAVIVQHVHSPRLHRQRGMTVPSHVDAAPGYVNAETVSDVSH